MEEETKAIREIFQEAEAIYEELSCVDDISFSVSNDIEKNLERNRQIIEIAKMIQKWV